MGQANITKSGPLAEMLREFSSKHHLTVGEPGNSERVSVLAALVDVPRNTMEEWFKRYTLPSGIRVCKLNLLLSLCGYEADERKKLSPVVRLFGDTLATVVTLEEAANEIGVTPKNPLFWLRGDAQPKQVQQVTDFNQKYAERRSAKIRLWKGALEENGFVEKYETVSDRKPIPPPATDLRSCDAEFADQTLIHLMKALGTTVRMCGVLSDDKRKKAIRQAVGHAELADLIGNLQKLSMASFNLS